jgi:trimethylamine:corrinoid methyltransferase-like protein
VRMNTLKAISMEDMDRGRRLATLEDFARPVMKLSWLVHSHERWIPGLSDWDTYAGWQEKGSEDVAIKANRNFKQILASEPQTLIDSQVDRALKNYIQRVVQH